MFPIVLVPRGHLRNIKEAIDVTDQLLYLAGDREIVSGNF